MTKNGFGCGGFRQSVSIVPMYIGTRHGYVIRMHVPSEVEGTFYETSVAADK
jgi:hypothetical protein